MGAQRRTVAFFVWLVLMFSCVFVSGKVVQKRDYGDEEGRLCGVSGCNCTSAAGGWKTVNCTFGASQRIIIDPGSVPSTTIELSIIGGAEITVNAQSFHLFRGFNLLRIDGTAKLTFRKNAFDNLNSTLLILQVLNCDRFVLENHAFKNMQTPIRAEISRCRHVSVRNSAFSRMDEARFEDISELELSEGAFTFENQGDIGHHGPATNLSFNNVSIDKIPGGTFTSALAEVNIQRSTIGDVEPHAFKASQINAVFVNSTTIRRLHYAALSDRSLILHFVLSKCRVHVMERQAFMAAISNLTVQFSVITEIRNAAINSSVTANIVISDNEIKTIAPRGLIFNNWNRLYMENNIIAHLGDTFLELPYSGDVEAFSFSDNDIYNADENSFKSIPELEYRLINYKFKNNFFNKSCACDMSEWLVGLLNNTVISNVLGNNFCTVDSVIARCFNINQGMINMRNFSELVCGEGSVISCEPYNGETKIIDANSEVLKDAEDSSNLLITLVIIGVLIFAAVATTIALAAKAFFWMKRKCGRNSSNNNEDEGAMVTEDTSDRYEFPEELTQELLQELREQLENPATHEKARELIEKLYEQFIVDDPHANNNKQEEEAHLYEELGSMQSGGNFEIKQLQHGSGNNNGIADFLKLMEDKLNFPLIDHYDGEGEAKPRIVGDYSEPTDAAVHLYSELKNKIEEEKGSIKSIKSQASSNGSKMAFRPLPEKPKDEPGPSSKF